MIGSLNLRVQLPARIDIVRPGAIAIGRLIAHHTHLQVHQAMSGGLTTGFGVSIRVVKLGQKQSL